jgi:type IV secretory pathway VirB4 component
MLHDTARSAPGVVIGLDLYGGIFSYDPFSLYASGQLSNPNLIVFGQIGRGKSAFVKTFLYRQLAFDRAAFVVDPKGEYGSLARAVGVEPLALKPGGALRLNPLDLMASTGDDGTVRRLQLLESLVGSSMGRELLSRERTALELALTEVAGSTESPTLPLVAAALLEPALSSAKAIHSTVARLGEDGRDVGLELRRLIHGDLRGIFDGETSASLALDGPVIVLDLSALYGSEALGLLMVCATAWLQSLVQRQRARGRQAFVVVDEAWAILRDLAVARWLQTSWKLARAWGVSNMAVLHRVSDLAAVGAEGSEQRSLAQGILLDSETRVIYGQPPGELESARQLLSLNGIEIQLLQRLARGSALWKVGSHSSVVHHLLGPGEATIVDTDSAMR